MKMKETWIKVKVKRDTVAPVHIYVIKQYAMKAYE
jgi:hypothetical protein